MNVKEILTLVFVAIAIVGVFFDLYVYYRHIRLFGAARYRECLRTFRRAQHDSQHLGARDVAYGWLIVTLLVTILTIVKGGSSALWLASPFAMLTVWNFQPSLAAPAVLVLGASASGSPDLMHSVTRAIFPFRVKHMLEERYLGGASAGSMRQNRKRQTAEGWGLAREEPWRDVLVRFLQVIPIILIDARQLTPPVDWEIKQIARLHLAYKTIFLTAPKTTVGDSASQVIYSQQECAYFLRFMLNASSRIPAPQRPVATLYQKFRTALPEIRRLAELGRARHSTWPYRSAISELRNPSNVTAAELFDKAEKADMREMRNHFSPRGKRQQLYEDATILYQQAIANDRNCTKIQGAFGIFLARCGKLDEATEYFESANDLAPSNAWIEANLAACYDQLRRHDLAEHWWQEAKRHRPPDRRA